MGTKGEWQEKSNLNWESSWGVERGEERGRNMWRWRTIGKFGEKEQ